MTKKYYDLYDTLEKWFANAAEVVVAGIGNPIRMDDVVGIKIIQDLDGKISKKVRLLECETVPENFMELIIKLKPTHLLIIDAAFLGNEPGAIRLIKPEQIANFPAVTTHILPLRIFCGIIKKMTSAKIALLLIEPENTEFGEGITPKVQVAAEKITIALQKILQ